MRVTEPALPRSGRLRHVEDVLAGPRRVAWRKAEFGGGELISRNRRSADCRRRPHRRQMLRQQPGIASAGADVDETKGARGHHRQAQGGAENLAAAFAMRTIESENIHRFRSLRALTVVSRAARSTREGLTA